MAERPAVNRRVAGSTPAAASPGFSTDPNPVRFKIVGGYYLEFYPLDEVITPNPEWFTPKTLC